MFGSEPLSAPEPVPSNMPMMFTLSAHEEGRATGRLFLGAPYVAGQLDRAHGAGAADVTAELSILHSRALMMRAVWEAGLNVLISGANRKAAPAITVARAELPQTAYEPQHYRLRFKSDTKYDLYADRTRLGTGTLGAPFDTDSLRLVIKPLPHRLPEAGAEYELLVSPLEEAIERVQQNLRLTIQADAESEEEARTVELEFRDEIPHRAGVFLRQLVLAYVEHRHGWEGRPSNGGSALALTSGNPTYDAEFQRGRPRGVRGIAAREGRSGKRVGTLNLCLGAIAVGMVAAAITRAGSSSDPVPSRPAPATAEVAAPAAPEPAAEARRSPVDTSARSAVPASQPPQATPAPSPPQQVPPPVQPEPAVASPLRGASSSLENVAPPVPAAPALVEAAPAPVEAAPSPAAAARTTNKAAEPVARQPASRAKAAEPRSAPAPAFEEPTERFEPKIGPSRQGQGGSSRFQAGPYDLPTNPY